MRRRTSALAGMAAVAALVGCGTDDVVAISAPETSETAVSGSASQHPTTEPPADDSSAGDPAFPTGTARQFAKHKGEWDLVFTDVRVAAHEGFDRLVLEFAGSGTPGWAISYVDEAVLDGSGRAVKLRGDAFLDLYASGVTWPASGYYAGPSRLALDDGSGVLEVLVGGTFEGYTQVLAGIGGDAVPFRVFSLTEPSRLVVDVVDAHVPPPEAPGAGQALPSQSR